MMYRDSSKSNKHAYTGIFDKLEWRQLIKKESHKQTENSLQYYDKRHR